MLYKPNNYCFCIFSFEFLSIATKSFLTHFNQGEDELQLQSDSEEPAMFLNKEFLSESRNTGSNLSKYILDFFQSDT